MKVIALFSSLACVLSWGLASIPAESAARQSDGHGHHRRASRQSYQ